MIDNGNLATALRDLADRDAVDEAPTHVLLRRGRRRRSMRLTTAATAAVVAAGLAVAAVAVSAGGGAQDPVPLGLAASTTEQSPYRFRFTGTVLPDDAVRHVGSRTSIVSGAYDPVLRRGYYTTEKPADEKPADDTNFIKWDERAIGDTCYTHYAGAAQWQRHPRPCYWVSSESVLTNPIVLLDQLQRPGSVRYQGRFGDGSEAVDRWAISYTWPVDPRTGDTNSYTGTVDVTVATGRISTVRYRMVNVDLEPGQPSPSTSALTSAQDVVVEYSDYGKPVTVTAPTGHEDVAPTPQASETR